MTILSHWDVSRDQDEPNADIRPGDRVCTGANVLARHQVIAISGEKAWVRDLQSGCDGITSLSRCHRAPEPSPAC